MLLAIDVGNTNITLGRFDGERPTVSRRPTRPDATADDLSGILDGADDVVVASVVPTLTATLAALCSRRQIPLLIADWQTIPIPIRVDRPAEVGPDRLVNAYAAARLYGRPAIVIDLGTATTFDVVDASGAFIGGAIAPGLELGLEALSKGAARLPRVTAQLPRRAIGQDTVTAIQSGAVLGHIGLVRELRDRIEEELLIASGQDPEVILTGGLSRAPWAGQILADVIDPDLTLRGLGLLHAEVASAAGAPSSA